MYVAFGVLPQRFYCIDRGFVIRVLRHLTKVFNIGDGIVSIHDEDRTHVELEFLDEHAIRFTERTRFIVGERNDPVNACGSAPTGLGERKVGTDRKDHHIIAQTSGFFIETACLCIAYPGVEGRNDADQLDFTGIILKRYVFEQVLLTVKSGAASPALSCGPMSVIGLPLKVAAPERS